MDGLAGLVAGVLARKRVNGSAEGERTGTTEGQLLALEGTDALLAKLREESMRERMKDEATALLMIGLDEFGLLLGKGGRGAGEQAEWKIAQALGAALPRKADLLARVDTARFAVVLPGTDMPGALRVAARLRWAVLRLELGHPTREKLTVSFGLAVECGGLQGGGAPLLMRAQTLLEAAQAGGGDRTEHAVLNPSQERAMVPVMRQIRAGVVPVNLPAQPMLAKE